MTRLLAAALALGLVTTLSLPADATAKCTGSSCTTKKPVKKKPSQEVPADARARYYQDALKFCKQKYGAPARIWKIDYTHHRVWCEPPSY